MADASSPADPAPAGAERGSRKSTAKGRQRQEEIYEAAAEIFDRKGYAAATLADIGDAVGLLKGSLYYYIGSKEDLLYHITRTIHDGTIATIEASEAAGSLPTDQLRTLLHSHIGAFESHATWIRVFYAEYGHLSKERRAEIHAVRRRYQDYVEGLIADGQERGIFCPEHDARIIANMILTTVNGVFLWYRAERDQSLATIADSYTNFTLSGLRCPPEHDHH